MLYENPYFCVTSEPNRTGSSLTDREIVVSYYSQYDFLYCNTISFIIDTQMLDCNLFYFFLEGGGGGTNGSLRSSAI